MQPSLINLLFWMLHVCINYIGKKTLKYLKVDDKLILKSFEGNYNYEIYTFIYFFLGFGIF